MKRDTLSSFQQGIQQTGFLCQHCGTCCKETEPGSNIVMVSPAEVRKIMEKINFAFEEIVEPYPDTICEEGREYTFDWAIRRIGDRCIFWDNNRCIIYDVRPWICRTYPFMINNGSLITFPCNGIGTSTGEEPRVINQMIQDLIDRQRAETAEEERISEVLTRVKIPDGKLVVIDGEGMRIMNG